MLFLMTAGGNVSLVQEELNNDFVRGNDNHPTDITSAWANVVNYKSAQPQQHRPHQYYPPDMELTQEGLTLAQNVKGGPMDISTVTCRHPDCEQTGHFQNSMACPIWQQKEISKAAEYDKIHTKMQVIKKKIGSDDK